MSASKQVEQLIIELHQGDFTARSNAARDLGKSRDPRAVDALLPDLKDKDWRVRRNAAQALGALRAKAAVEPLIQALKDRTMTVRMRAAVALGRIKDPRAVPALVNALQDREGDVVDSAVQALKKFGKAALPALTAALPALHGPRRLELLRVLSDIPGANVVDDLRELLKDQDHMIRAQALMLLVKIADPRAPEAIQRHISDPHPYVQMCAVEALGHFKDSHVIGVLLKQLSDHELYGQNREIYRMVTGALQKIAGLLDEYSDVLNNRPAALAGLLSDEQRIDLNLLMSQYSVMIKKMTGIEDAAPGASLPPHLQKLMNTFDQVRGAGNTATQQADALMGLLNSPSPLTRAAASLSLAWYMDQRALQPLAIARMDPDPHVQAAADWAYETLRKTLEDRSQLSGTGY